jgi:hypothetical protein
MGGHGPYKISIVHNMGRHVETSLELLGLRYSPLKENLDMCFYIIKKGECEGEELKDKIL